MRALAALGIDPALVHLNEGHAAFAVLELARAEAARGAPLEAALEAARQRTVFTTHTPVAAGNETYPREEVIGTVGDLMAELGVEREALLRLGRYHPEDGGEPFGMTTFSLRMSRAANGVSRRHGGVAREMWSGPVARAGGGGGADHPCHQRRAPAELGRGSDAPPARPPPR